MFAETPAKFIRPIGSKHIIVKYIAPKTVSLAKTSSIYSAVFCPGLIPGRYAPDLFKLSETSLVLKVSANQMKQKLIINPAKTNIYKGCPGLIANAKVLKKLNDSFLPNHSDSEAGKSKKVLAKIAGITPAIFTLNGRWLD